MSIEDQIINLIRSNRISTTEVSDALGKRGGLLGVKPLNPGKFAVGRIHHCFPNNDSNFEVHKSIENLEQNAILIISPHRFTDVSVIGDLVAKYCLLYRQASAIVVEGNVRDVARLKKEDYQIWSKGINPVGATNGKIDSSLEEFSQSPDLNGGIAVCDDGGVVIIERADINIVTFESLVKIEALEDLWQFCLNTLKWSTFDIVVNKKYNYDQFGIPEQLLNAAGIKRIEN